MRLDLALVSRGLARSRNHAATLIRTGRVSVDGAAVTRASRLVTDQSVIHADADRWVSRAALKLLGALEESGTPVGARVLDAGASTGGFTQVCLERGAERVYAIDVGHDQLVPELRSDPRVVVREGLNLRNLVLDDVDGEPVDLVVGDVSFISLTLVLEPLLSVLAPGGSALLLVKPQFEVGRHLLGGGGVVRDPALRQAAVDAVVDAAMTLGWACDWWAESILPGTSGNVEFFVRLTG
ncbi:TlyA family RNA methyltransferase [Tessaracoccus antarcticus]|uniref:TlyA family RNA methyltransferase n=1 Tax=Tessaracoccus antarcticus TaxID=2479848 RepID=UPI001F179EFE|nr:TlyA family RNA methyltransferase [Tessaracoccus antarcticus]